MPFKYFNNHLNPGFVSLYTGRMIQFVGSNLVSLFIPIYLLIHLDYRVELVLFFFLLGHLYYALFLPFGAQFLNMIGLRRSLQISIGLFSLYYVALFFVEYNLILSLVMALAMLTLGRTFFWFPYNTDLAKFTNKQDRGKSIGLIWATSSFLGVIMPLISGLLIARFGYSVVFVLAIIIYLTSIIPYLTLPRTRERFSWCYAKTFKKFFSKKYRKMVLANMANGAENAVGLIIWPIFIWQLFKGNYVAVGAISSLIVLATIIVQLIVGKYTDVFDKRKMIRWGSLLYASGWMAKVFILTSFQVFIIGAYHSFAQIFKDTPFDTLNYEMMADQGHYVDELTVLKEIAVQLGKVLMLGFAIVIAVNFGLNWTFALAALASLFINLL